MANTTAFAAPQLSTEAARKLDAYPHPVCSLIDVDTMLTALGISGKVRDFVNFSGISISNWSLDQNINFEVQLRI